MRKNPYFKPDRYGRVIYPSTCISMYCGSCGDECFPCQFYPRLKVWKEMQDAGEIYCSDEIWSPNVYYDRDTMEKRKLEVKP